MSLCSRRARLERLDLLTDVENVASRRVAEKAGFQEEGVLRSHLTYDLVTVPGNHSLKADLEAVVTAVRDWLPRAVAPGRQDEAADR